MVAGPEFVYSSNSSGNSSIGDDINNGMSGAK